MHLIQYVRGRVIYSHPPPLPTELKGMHQLSEKKKCKILQQYTQPSRVYPTAPTGHARALYYHHQAPFHVTV